MGPPPATHLCAYFHPLWSRVYARFATVGFPQPLSNQSHGKNSNDRRTYPALPFTPTASIAKVKTPFPTKSILCFLRTIRSGRPCGRRRAALLAPLISCFFCRLRDVRHSINRHDPSGRACHSCVRPQRNFRTNTTLQFFNYVFCGIYRLKLLTGY